MRNQALGLSALFVLSLVVTACGGSSADIKKVGLVTDVGTLEDKSFNEAAWLGAQAGATDISGKASNIVTKAPADYATNIKTFVDQSYGLIVTVGFAMGDATTTAAKQYPNVKFIGVDQGVCVDPTGAPDPTFACKGDREALLPNYQGLVYNEAQAGYLAGVSPRSISKSGVIGAVGGINTIPAVVRYINGYRNRREVGSTRDIKVLAATSRRTSRRPSTTRATGKSIAQQMIGQKADVIFQVAGLTGAGALEAACAAPSVVRHRRRRRPVAVSARISQVHRDQRREEARQTLSTAAITEHRGRDRQVAARSVVRRLQHPVGVGISPYHDLRDLDHPGHPGEGRRRPRRDEGRDLDPCKPTDCDKAVGRPATSSTDRRAGMRRPVLAIRA